MKKQNKIYLPLKEQGIKKAWDKVSIFRTKEDTGYKGGLQMVVYWQGKPFCYFSVKNAYDINDIKLTLSCMLEYYETLPLNYRKNSKRITKYFIENEVKGKVITYTCGGVLFPYREG
jgi:hypothetical protein